MRRVLSEERGKCCSPRPFCGYSRATPRDASHYLICRRCQPSQSTGPHQPAFAQEEEEEETEEEEEGLFKADAVNEESYLRSAVALRVSKE